MSRNKKTFTLPVVWQAVAVLNIEAESFEEAKKLVDEIPFPPKHFRHLEDSMEIDESVLLDFVTPTQIKVKTNTRNRWYSNRQHESFNVIRVSETKEYYVVDDNGKEREIPISECVILDIA